jgi:hypothetical protein
MAGRGVDGHGCQRYKLLHQAFGILIVGRQRQLGGQTLEVDVPETKRFGQGTGVWAGIALRADQVEDGFVFFHHG